MRWSFWRVTAVTLALGMACLATAAAQQAYVVKPIAEKKVRQLPSGELYWRVETFPTLAQAKAIADGEVWNPDAVRNEPSLALAAEVAGKVWLFTLGRKGAATPGGRKVAEIGPVPALAAPEYLLRVNHGSGPPGSMTPVHSHPGSEAFYIVSGRLGQRSAHGVQHAEAGQTMNGHAPGMVMQVFNAGETDLTALIMFVVDASRPFSVPAKF